MHTLPTNDKVWLVDLPGGATKQQPASTYCLYSCLDQADALILCYSKRFSELDDAIATTARAHGIQFILVYTNADVDARSKARCSPGSEGQAKADLQMRMVREDVSARLPAMAGPDAHLYFVDSRNLRADGFDGKRLLRALSAL